MCIFSSIEAAFFCRIYDQNTKIAHGNKQTCCTILFFRSMFFFLLKWNWYSNETRKKNPDRKVQQPFIFMVTGFECILIRVQNVQIWRVLEIFVWWNAERRQRINEIMWHFIHSRRTTKLWQNVCKQHVTTYAFWVGTTEVRVVCITVSVSFILDGICK